MSVSFLSERAAKRVRKVPVRNDLVDVSYYLNGVGTSAAGEPETQVYVSVRLVNWLKRLGTEEGIEKLKKVVNRGAVVMRHNNGNRKSNFIVDLVPQEFYSVERYYGEQTPGLVIDCELLQAAERLRGNV